jgi:two-component system NtrC family sensor kinase
MLLGFSFAFSTLRSVSTSLRLLKDGTTAFGKGQWDFRIKLHGKDELSDLAKAFNEMAQSIKQLETQNIHMHRMSAVGQLAGGVAHEINNPLTGVLGQAQLLLDKMTSEDPRRGHLEKIERAALRCRRIVRSLLDFSRQKETQFDQISLIDTLEATLDLCETDLQGSHVNVVKNFDIKIPPIQGNASQLQQVFLNVITNSIQAMPKGGSVSISTGLVTAEVQGKPGQAVEIKFTDQGIGILPEHIEHLFEPFFTTKEIGKGTGLGLSVSLGIVRNHGGDIRVESPGPGRGATFKIYLPVSAAAVGPGADISAASARARFVNETDTRY